ncbi:hypothetical protein F4604DRAFT_1927378 [Suillus subluteus]|nr:hypothetical protein F4604DRAFT_1927378 [Suillus subluteus]
MPMACHMSCACQVGSSAQLYPSLAPLASFPKATPNVDYDVVKWHQRTNCRAHSPSPMYLHSVRHSNFAVNQLKPKHTRTSNLCSDNGHQVAGDSDDNMRVDTDSEDGAAVAKHKTLGFFLDLWVKLLNCTKACYRLHLAITDPFPACEEALSDTGICMELIMELIVAWEAQNRHLEAGIQLSGWSNMSYPIFRTYVQ